MKKLERNSIEGIARNRNGVRPVYIPLDEDTDGASHIYRTTNETIHVLQEGERVQRFDLGVRTVDDYVKFVRDKVDSREWENRRYIADDEDPFTVLLGDLVEEVAA